MVVCVYLCVTLDLDGTIVKVFPIKVSTTIIPNKKKKTAFAVQHGN